MKKTNTAIEPPPFQLLQERTPQKTGGLGACQSSYAAVGAPSSSSDPTSLSWPHTAPVPAILGQRRRPSIKLFLLREDEP